VRAMEADNYTVIVWRDECERRKLSPYKITASGGDRSGVLCVCYIVFGDTKVKDE